MGLEIKGGKTKKKKKKIWGKYNFRQNQTMNTNK